jgi:glucosylceramidase
VNPDGSTVLVAHNENDNPQAFGVRFGDSSFRYTLPGGALATFVWKGRSADRPLAPVGWTATGVGEAPASAVDDDAATRFTTGAPQQPGQFLSVDFGRATRIDRVVFDAGASLGDYPRAFTATTSSDGKHWSPARTIETGQLTTLQPRQQKSRFIRVELTAASESWWSVADVRAYLN